MTRAECEDKILEKLDEIDEIAREYNQKAYHLSMYIIGSAASVTCVDEDTDEDILRKHNHKWSDGTEVESDA